MTLSKPLLGLLVVWTVLIVVVLVVVLQKDRNNLKYHAIIAGMSFRNFSGKIQANLDDPSSKYGTSVVAIAQFLQSNQRLMANLGNLISGSCEICGHCSSFYQIEVQDNFGTVFA